MTLEEQISNLEQRIDTIEANLESKLDEINDGLKNISRGIYGDPENKATGLIEKLMALEKRVQDIEKKQEVEVIKKDTIGVISSKAVKIFGIIMMIYLIFKNVVGVDTIIELFLRK